MKYKETFIKKDTQNAISGGDYKEENIRNVIRGITYRESYLNIKMIKIKKEIGQRKILERTDKKILIEKNGKKNLNEKKQGEK